MPKLHAKSANDGIRHDFGEADQLEVERSKSGVGVSDRRRYKPSDEMCIVIACPGERASAMENSNVRARKHGAHTGAASSSMPLRILRRHLSRIHDSLACHGQTFSG